MTDTLKIYNDFCEINPSDSMGIIRFYESNTLVLDNKTGFKDEDEFDDFITIIGQYILSLETLGKYSKAITYADKALTMIDLKKDEYEIELKDYTTYWSILTIKGRSHYYVKDYNNSITIFKRLISWDNSNDNFMLWLNSAKSKKRNSKNKYLYILATILILTEISFGNQFTSPKLKLYLSGAGFSLFLVAKINEYSGDKIIKLIKKK